MTDIHYVILAALWTLLLVHGLLLLLLYRQVEKAYRFSEGGASMSALPAGTEAPELHVLRGTQVRPLSPPLQDRLHLYLFTNTTCQACTDVVRYLASAEVPAVPVTVLVGGEGVPPYADAASDRLTIVPLAHPADAAELYGVTNVPALYALRGNTVLAGDLVPTRQAVDAVLDLAEEVNASLTREAG